MRPSCGYDNSSLASKKGLFSHRKLLRYRPREPTQSLVWTSVHVAADANPDWSSLNGAFLCAAGGEPTKHLGYHSAVQPPLPSSSPACFPFFILRNRPILPALRFVLHILSTCSVHWLSCCRFILLVVGRSYSQRLAADQSLPLNVGHIVTFLYRKLTALFSSKSALVRHRRSLTLERH